MPKPACRLGDQANCPDDSHGKGCGGTKTVFAVLTLCFLLLPPCTASAVDTAQPKIEYTIFTNRSGRTADTRNTKVSIHPHLEGGTNNLVVVSVQEHDILKVALYYDKDLQMLSGRLYIHNPSMIDYTGVPAYYMGDHKGLGVTFADGTKLYKFLPPNAREKGTSEWMYLMRWRRIYKNYYLITFFRPSGACIQEDLMAERDGQDLTPILGDSSVDRDLKHLEGIITGDDKYLISKKKINGETIRTHYNLIRVYEKDLPPDFPKGLVRWFP